MTLRGLTTVNYHAADLPAAVRWYSELLGIEPYFERKLPDGTPAYVEFRLGDYQHELGIIADGAMEAGGLRASRISPPGGAVVYWHVDDIPATLQRLREMGAHEHEPTRDFGGFIAASVIDPFGNILGVMYNPHYLDVLGTRGSQP